MSEDIQNVEADLEALMAALEMIGAVAGRARRDALRLAQHLRADPPRSRQEWADRAQLVDGNGRDLGWLDTSQARRIELSDATGANDRNVPTRQQEADRGQEGPGELVELEGQFFEVQAGARRGAPEQVRPISLDDAQARLAEHRPDLQTRMVGDEDPRLEIAGRAAEPGRAGHDRRGLSTAAEQFTAPPAAAGASRGRSAAEAFGAVDEPTPRGRAEESEAAPSSAELTAVGATKPAETTLHR